MEQPTSRPKFILPLVAVVAFVLGGASVLACFALLRHWDRPDHGMASVRADISVLGQALDSYAMNNVSGPYPIVTTFGADGKPGGTGDDKDIDSVSIANGR